MHAKKAVWLVGPARAGLALAALGALPLLAGLGGVQRAAAAGPSIPIIGASGVVGIVELDGVGDLSQLVITLQGARPNTTYIVQDCQIADDSTVACAPGTADATIVTDAAGDAQKTVTFTDVSRTDEVRLTNAADSTDVDVASAVGAVLVPSSPYLPTGGPQ